MTPEDYNRRLLQKILQEWCPDLHLEIRKEGIVLSRDSLQLIENAAESIKLVENLDASMKMTSITKLTLPESTVRLYLVGTAVRDEILPNLDAKYLKLKEVKKRTRRGRGGSWKIKIPVIEEKNVERALKEALKTKIKHKKDEKMLVELKKNLARCLDDDDHEASALRELIKLWNSITISPSSPLFKFLKPLVKLNQRITSIEQEIKTIDATINYHDAEIRRLHEEQEILRQKLETLHQTMARHPLKQKLDRLEKTIEDISSDSNILQFLKQVHHVVHAHLREIEHGRAKPTKFFKELQAWHDNDSLGFSEDLAKHWSPLVEYMLMNAEDSLKSMRWFIDEFQQSVSQFQYHLTKSEMAQQFLVYQQTLSRKHELKVKIDQTDEIQEISRLSQELNKKLREVESHEEKKASLTEKKAQLNEERVLFLKQLREASSSAS